MLQTIRDHAQGWIAWIIVGLIILTFALFGIEQYAQGQKTVVVATVNGEKITAKQFLTLYQRQKMRLQQQFGEMYDQVVKDEELRKQVLEALIQSEAIKQYAKAHHLVISDQQLAAMIHAAPVFHQDGKFDQKLYEDILLRNGLSVAQFETEQRQNLIEQQFKQLSLASTFATPSEVAQIVALESQERKVAYLGVPKYVFMPKVKVSEAELQKYYQAHQADFVEPEKIKIDYVLLSKQALAKKLQPTEAELKAYYEENKDNFIEPEKRRASHILIRFKADTPEAKAEAKKQIEEVLAKLKAGGDFAELAKKYSQDPGSAQAGGDLGFFNQGVMVKPFDDAVFSMKEGEVRGPIETQFGYHIIKLTKIQPKKVLPYEAVKEQVKAEWLKQQADKQYYALVDKLTSIAYEQPDSLEPAAEAIGMKVQTSEPFSRQGGKDSITSNPKVIQAAFSDEVLKSHENSSVIELSPNESIVIRINQVIPEKQLTFDEVKTRIQKQLVSQKAQAAAKAKAEALLKQVMAGTAPEKLAGEGIIWKDLGWVNRGSRQVSPELLQAIFKAKKPTKDQPSWQVIELPNGDAVVLEVMAVRVGKAPSAEQKQQLQKALADVYGNAELTGRLAALLRQAEIERKQNYLTLK
ncbi:SurA N-terminal domain-containing protein [Galenea microaerophila]